MNRFAFSLNIISSPVLMPNVTVIEEISIESVTPKTPVIVTVIDLDEVSVAISENAANARKRMSPQNMTPPSTPREGRSILQPIGDNNEISSPPPLRSPTIATALQRHPSSCDTPTSFVGSPVKKKRRMSSIRRL